MAMATGSATSRIFRENVLTQTIMSIFKSDRKTQTRISSSATGATDDSTAPIKNRHAGITVNALDGAESALVPGNNEVLPHDAAVDPMAGNIEGGVNYQTMAWWQAGAMMVAETISLGILSLPKALSDVGLIPGLILLVALGIMASYSGYIIGQYKLKYPQIHSFADAGKVLFGRGGQAIFGGGQLLFYVFIMASHILTFAIMMNVITDHALCTIIFMVVGALLSFILTLPRKCGDMSWLSVISFASIIGAVVITMASVGSTRPGFDPLGNASFRLWPRPGIEFAEAFSTVANITFAYAGHVAFFTFISELRNPRDFKKSLAFLQCSDISMYIITAVVIYYYAGDGVRSPAINSARPLFAKIAYGVAMPTIVIAGVVNGHVAVKYVYVLQFRNDAEGTMHKRTLKAYGFWWGYCALLWFLAWIIAETIPIFNELLGLTSALFASWFTFGCSGMFWFHMNFRWARRGELAVMHPEKECDNECTCHVPVKSLTTIRVVRAWNWKMTVAFVFNILNLVTAAILCFAGLYASFKSLTSSGTQRTKPFSCASNGPKV